MTTYKNSFGAKGFRKGSSCRRVLGLVSAAAAAGSVTVRVLGGVPRIGVLGDFLFSISPSLASK